MGIGAGCTTKKDDRMVRMCDLQVRHLSPLLVICEMCDMRSNRNEQPDFCVLDHFQPRFFCDGLINWIWSAYQGITGTRSPVKHFPTAARS